MVSPSQLTTGDYVVATADIFDYATPGSVFKIIDKGIPGQEGSALGWKISLDTGAVEGGQAYPLPHEKIAHMARAKLASLMAKQLAPLKAERRGLDRQIELIESRIRNIENTASRDEEEVTFLRSFLSFV